MKLKKCLILSLRKIITKEREHMRMYICMRFKKTKLLLKSSTSKILSMAMKKERLWKKLSKQLEVAPEFYNTME